MGINNLVNITDEELLHAYTLFYKEKTIELKDWKIIECEILRRMKKTIINPTN